MNLRSPQELNSIAERCADQYAQAEPFPHIIFDGLFPLELLRAANAEIDASREKDIWKHRADAVRLKWGTNRLASVGKATSTVADYLASRDFVAFLERLTGIGGLHADPTLQGAGVHSIRRGGFLKIHVDFNYHEEIEKYRRVNLLLYLNEDWQPDFGGNLELWNPDVTECVSSIPPRMNTCVVFTASSRSYHGHPDPLNCPPERARNSLAAYYYTDEPGEDVAAESHSTLYSPRPNEGRRTA